MMKNTKMRHLQKWIGKHENAPHEEARFCMS